MTLEMKHRLRRIIIRLNLLARKLSSACILLDKAATFDLNHFIGGNELEIDLDPTPTSAMELKRASADRKPGRPGMQCRACNYKKSFSPR